MINAPTEEELRKIKIPPLYATEDIPLEEKLVYAHFQFFDSHWYACEFDGVDTFFGYVILNGCLQDAELGYFTLSQLIDVNLCGWLEVENNPYWVIRPLKDIGLVQETLAFQRHVVSRMAAQQHV